MSAPTSNLTIRASSLNEANPFEGDLLSREQLAQRLTSVIERMPLGAVIAIDAPWGEGKTWFGRRWAATLGCNDGNQKVAFIDAFANDYVEDPFVVLTAELTKLLSKGGAVKRKAGPVLRALAPVAAKGAISFAGRLLLGSPDVGEDVAKALEKATEAAAEQAGKFLEKRLGAYEAGRRSIDGFKEALRNAAAAEERRVVVFIDELDRCRPSFAVSLLERIKHFFDVPNLVFVLLLNRQQLENAIRGVYGHDVDGEAYLGKFVNIWFELPTLGQRDPQRQEQLAFVQQMLGRYGVQGDHHFATDMQLWTMHMRLSLRDIERTCALYVLANDQTALVNYLIATKVKWPGRFSNLRLMDVGAHRLAAKWLSELRPNEPSVWPGALFKNLEEMHRILAGDSTYEGSPSIQAQGHHVFGRHVRDLAVVFRRAVGQIDLTS